MAAGPFNNDKIQEFYRASATDQLMFINNSNSDGQMHSLITFSGRVDAGLMARSIRLSLDAEPVLGCRMTKGPFRLRWQRSDSLDSIDLCPVIETVDALNEALRFMAAPMDTFTAPQIQARLFRSDRDVLCVKMTHAVADGGGFKEYLELLSSIYRHACLDPGYRPVPNSRGNRSPWQLEKHVGLSTLAQSSLHITIPGLEWCFPVTSSDYSGRSFLTAEIGPERSAAIRAYAHGKGIKINDLLLTAFYRALFEVLDPPAGKPLPVTVPVNLRRYMPSGKAGSICSLSGLFIPAINREPGEAFEDTLSRVHEFMDTAKRNKMDLSQMLFLQTAFVAGYMPMSFVTRHFVKQRARALMTIPCFSNLGIIGPKDVNFGDIKVTDISLFGPVTFPPYLDFTVYSFGDTMRCSISYCDTAADVNLVKSLLDDFIREISGLI
ncbi:hypothetical protein CUJ83_10125 [Methanocella sp. CWC-04]|uniref:O-acyltransferase WSD1 C-terminal domain-containing protein n=1 Tax=Methanooceanicella nereidis TaxID=2052831 RepID=A0AAP2REK7_9EURY|nr:WS/DGAT domain-containing protein [Methanocella sp. CWC-04]MCD1295356.1 hypothetical protein [Methanocella sp. CWC-04]